MNEKTLEQIQPHGLTPKDIVEELDRYVIGQKNAKRAVAIALRNRWRRQQVQGYLKDEITPKNIIMIGPTGVGKTEIARRLARLVKAPFVKVEASKFTEVGYVGRDVESMVRDLVEVSIKLVKDEELERVKSRAKEIAEEKLLDILLPIPVRNAGGAFVGNNPSSWTEAPEIQNDRLQSREKFRSLLREKKLDDREVEIELSEQSQPSIEIFGASGPEQMGFDLTQLQKLFGGTQKKKKRKVPIKEALHLISQEEADRLIDMEKVQKEGLSRAEQSGIIFLDEIDKIAGGKSPSTGPDISREGVQRDLLPIVEGTNVSTKYGSVKTDHVLFIAAGAFHISKPSDLLPEIQGRFPIRVELEPLRGEDLVKILREPENSLIKQYTALLSTEGIDLTWDAEAILTIGEMAMQANEQLENIGARRLQTLLELILDDVSFNAPELSQKNKKTFKISRNYVLEKVQSILTNQDLSQYIL